MVLLNFLHRIKIPTSISTDDSSSKDLSMPVNEALICLFEKGEEERLIFKVIAKRNLKIH